MCPGAPEWSRGGDGGGSGDEVSLAVSAGDSYQSWAMKGKGENEAKGPMEGGWTRSWLVGRCPMENRPLPLSLSLAFAPPISGLRRALRAASLMGDTGAEA